MALFKIQNNFLPNPTLDLYPLKLKPNSKQFNGNLQFRKKSKSKINNFFNLSSHSLSPQIHYPIFSQWLNIVISKYFVKKILNFNFSGTSSGIRKYFRKIYQYQRFFHDKSEKGRERTELRRLDQDFKRKLLSERAKEEFDFYAKEVLKI